MYSDLAGSHLRASFFLTAVANHSKLYVQDNCTISGETTDIAVAQANPIRYRGYYYDEDTGLYYCSARYYSPKWRRFISPDDTAYLDPSSVNGLNQYCYCNRTTLILEGIKAAYLS